MSERTCWLWLEHRYRGMADAEALNEAIREWLAAHGTRRTGYRRYALKLLMRMQAEKHAGRAALHAAAQRAQERRAA